MAGATLSQRDVVAVLEAAESFLDADSLEALRERAAEIVSALVPSTLVSWNEVDLRGSRLAMVRSASLLEPTDPAKIDEFDAAFMQFVGEHPVIAHYQQTRDGRPYAISDFLSAAAFHRTNLYQRLDRHLGTEDQISFVLPDPRLIIGIAVNRERRGFAVRDRTVCDLLRGYLVQSYRNVDASARTRQLLTTVHQLADDHGEAAVMLNEDGTPDQLSPHAHHLLQRFFGAFDPGTLPVELATWLDDRTTVTAPLLRSQDGRLLVVRRVRSGNHDVLFLFQKANDDTIADARQLGLTPREA